MNTTEKKYILLGYSATATEDNYNEGELNDVSSWDVKESKEFSSKIELINYINKSIIYTDYEENNFDFETGEGKFIHTDVLCSYYDYCSFFPANKKEIELWKNDKIKLYNVHYSIKVYAVNLVNY